MSAEQSLRERIRRAELEVAWPLFTKPQRVLELGGATGYQAKILSDWGHEVTSLDVDVPEDLDFPVQRYDGRTLPFADATFDVVFSSNVLEHVRDVPALLAEASRVLRPSGVMIHVLPSPTWRLWTNVAYYVLVVQKVFLRCPNPKVPILRLRRPYTLRKLLRFARSVAFPYSHGVHGNALWELYTYSVVHWRRVFEQSSLVVKKVAPAGIFYSGYKILRGLDVPVRRRLAKMLGSSCNVFVLARQIP
jgi:SAM-dependent methyltransferase